MINISDDKLTRHEKIELIMKWIPVRQAERWQRLKKFHSFNHIPMHARHFFMQKEVDLIRSQKIRLKKLIDSL